MSYPYAADHPNTGKIDETQSTPALPELLQETPSLDVKGDVAVVNPVRVYNLPSRLGVSRSYGLTEAVPLPLLGADPRRAKAILIGRAPSGSASIGFFIGGKDDVRALNAAIWPYGVPCPITHGEQVYVMPEGSTLAAGHMISVIAENWAD